MRLRSVFILFIWQTSLALSVSGQKDLVFKIGIIPYKSQEAVISTYTPLFEYLSKKTDLKIELSLVEEDALAYPLSKGDFDMGIFTPFPYLQAKLDFPDLEVFASHTVKRSDTYKGCIVVRKESKINSLKDLKGKNFLFVKPTSTSGYKYPKAIFKERDLDVDEGFFSYGFSGSHDASLDSLRKGKTDGIAIDTRVLEGLDEKEVARYEKIECYNVPYHAYVFSPQVASDVRAKIKDAMFEAHKNPENKSLFSNALEIDKWHKQTDEAYNSLRRYLGIARVKPRIALKIDMRSSARSALDEMGDVKDLLIEQISNLLAQSGRFSQITFEDSLSSEGIEVLLRISMVGEYFHANMYVQDTLVSERNFSPEILTDQLPQQLNAAVLRYLKIHTKLLQNRQGWFVTYGSNDGINTSDYTFEISEKGSEYDLSIEEITALKTVFVDQSDFKEGLPVLIRHKGNTVSISERFQLGNNSNESFWDNLDNRWGVIGLIVAFISIALGSYFTSKRKKRFKSTLHDANMLLYKYLKNKQAIDQDLLIHKDLLYKRMEKGSITENQFLILNKRIEDIDQIIHTLPLESSFPKEIECELSEILKDGTISEKEFSGILLIIRKHTSQK